MNLPLTRAAYAELLRAARRHARHADEAEDLLQDALLSALTADRSVALDVQAWFGGVLRNKARMQARGAVRRRRREAAWQAGASAPEAESAHALPADLPEDLSPALRIVLLLSLTGHSRAEIRHLLRLTDEALRQRIAALRRRLAGRQALPAEPLLAGGLRFGSLRRGLLPVVRHHGHLATHDPDGHGMVISFSPRHAHESPGGGN